MTDERRYGDEEVAGAVLLLGNALRLPRWAAEREEQMEYIATRARALIRPGPEPASLPEGA